MTDEHASLDFERYRSMLERLHDELAAIDETGQAAAETVMLDQTRVGRLSRMDAMQAQAMSQEANRRRALYVRQIREALARIDSGEYGDCTECGERIDGRRLDLDPAASMCIACASEAEAS